MGEVFHFFLYLQLEEVIVFIFYIMFALVKGLHQISNDKEAMVADFLVLFTGSILQNVSFWRSGVIGNLKYLHIFDSLCAMWFGNVLEGRMIWTFGKNKRFLVHFFIRPFQNSIMIIIFFGRLFGIVNYLLKLFSLYLSGEFSTDHLLLYCEVCSCLQNEIFKSDRAGMGYAL